MRRPAILLVPGRRVCLDWQRHGANGVSITATELARTALLLLCVLPNGRVQAAAPDLKTACSLYCDDSLTVATARQVPPDALANACGPVDDSSINRWAIRFLPLIEKMARKHKRPVGGSWRMDERYIKIKGVWKHPYRAVDKQGKTVVSC